MRPQVKQTTKQEVTNMELDEAERAVGQNASEYTPIQLDYLLLGRQKNLPHK